MNELYFIGIGVLVGGGIVFVSLTIWCSYLLISKSKIDRDIAFIKKDTAKIKNTVHSFFIILSFFYEAGALAPAHYGLMRTHSSPTLILIMRLNLLAYFCAFLILFFSQRFS